MDLPDLLKSLADPNRLRVLNLLEGRTLCVCDLEEVLGLNQSNLSRHLAKLKQAGLVTATKRGQFMHYSRRAVPAPLDAVVESVYRTLAHDPSWDEDRRALAARMDCSCSDSSIDT